MDPATDQLSDHPHRRAAASSSGPPGTAPVAERAALPLTGAATLVALMNYTAPMVLLPNLARDLDAGPSAQTWILTSISLGLAALLLTAGSLADNHGRKRIFVLGTAGLAVASVLCAVAPNAALFVAGRLAQGAASALVIAAGLGLLAQATPAGPARTRATAIWGAMLGAGIALGPLVAAGLLVLGGWRSGYLVTAVAAAAVGVAAACRLRESQAARQRPIDLPGMLACTLATAALVAALTLGRDGWARPPVLALAALAVLALVLFVLIERRSAAPMLDVELFRRSGFLLTTGVAFGYGLAVIGLMSVLPTLLQRAWGVSPARTAWLFAAWSGVSFLAALQARRVGGRSRPELRFAAGLGITALANLLLLGAIPAGELWRVVLSLVISGVGSGILNATLAGQAVATVPESSSSMGSGANNTARYIGSSVGVAIVVVLAAPALAGARNAPGVDLVLAASTAVILLVTAHALFAARKHRSPTAPGPGARDAASYREPPSARASRSGSAHSAE